MIGLPLSADSFVGREQDVLELRDLVATTPLVTLFGPGGVGKSRLAVEVATRSSDRYPDGVVLVELTALADPELLTQTVAAAVGVVEPVGGSLLSAVAGELDGKHTLLLLDNCEHLIEHCASLVEALLRRCTRLRIMVTSREILRVPGEVTFRVVPLSLPAPGGGSSRAELHSSEAVRLFVERARRCVPGFELTPADRPLLAEVCTQLDGLPLAIELAASRTRLLTVEQIHTLLDDRFSLLSLGLRTSAQRHRSLEAAIGWSHDLLDAAEQAVFRRLAVLAGGFDMACATAVCAAGDVRPAAVLDILANLETKSLLVPVPTSDALRRFRQLESVRLYAAERLDEAGETEASQDRMVAWLIGLAEPALEMFFPGSRLAATLTDEIENLQHAVDWARGHDDDRQTLLAGVLVARWQDRGHISEGRRLLAAVLAETRGAATHRAYALGIGAYMSFEMAEFSEAARQAAAALEIGRAVGHPATMVRALGLLGMAHSGRGDFAGALVHFRECVDIANALGTPLDKATCLHNLAQCLLEADDVEAAAATIEEALTHFRARPDPYRLANLLHTAGAIALARDDLAEAAAKFTELLSLQSARQWSSPVYALEGLAVVAAHRREPDRAVRLAGAAAAARVRHQFPAEQHWASQVERAIALSRAMLADPDAAASAGAAWSLERAAAYALGGKRPDPRDDEAPSPLSEREAEIANLVAEGHTNREIATRLRISSRTVYNHLEQIRNKLDLRTRTQIATWVTGQRRPQEPRRPDQHP